jgi:hypothetical protein
MSIPSRRAHVVALLVGAALLFSPSLAGAEDEPEVEPPVRRRVGQLLLPAFALTGAGLVVFTFGLSYAMQDYGHGCTDEADGGGKDCAKENRAFLGMGLGTALHASTVPLFVLAGIKAAQNADLPVSVQASPGSVGLSVRF